MSGITTYFLEMTSLGELRETSKPEGLEVLEAEIKEYRFNRFLYSLVGEAWSWKDKLETSDDEWEGVRGERRPPDLGRVSQGKHRGVLRVAEPAPRHDRDRVLRAGSALHRAGFGRVPSLPRHQVGVELGGPAAGVGPHLQPGPSRCPGELPGQGIPGLQDGEELTARCRGGLRRLAADRDRVGPKPGLARRRVGLTQQGIS